TPARGIQSVSDGPAARGGTVTVDGIVGPRTGLKVRCPDEQCTVVYNLAALPGWKAYVDRVPTPVFRANYAFIALVVPKGDHYVWLLYTTPGQSIAEAISLISLLALLVLTGRKGDLPFSDQRRHRT